MWRWSWETQIARLSLSASAASSPGNRPPVTGRNASRAPEFAECRAENKTEEFDSLILNS